MSAPVYRTRRQSQAQIVQATLGCDEERALRVVRRLGALVDDPETRAFLVAFGEVGGVALDGMTGERALVHLGRREMALFLIRCAGLSLDPAAYGEGEAP